MLQTAGINPVLAEIHERKSALEAELSKRQRATDLRIKHDQFFTHKNIPAVFLPLLRPSRYKGAYGGRGSAKSHTFAELLLSKCLERRTRWMCVREFQISLEHSVKRLLEDKIKEYALTDKFRILTNHIETPKDGIIIFQGMKGHTAESIKSFEGYDGAWVEEAQMFSNTSLKLLRPTLRNDGSEMWFSWNPRFPTDPVDDMFRGNAPRKPDEKWSRPPDSILVKSNYSDNPLFPDVLRKEMEWDKGRDTELYEHVWEGEYEKHSEARVFKNWRIEEFEEPSNEFGDEIFYYGGDWGYSVDPAVLVRLRIKGRTLFVHHEAYRIGCEIDHIPDLFDTVPGARSWPIIADSARPETISYLNRHGFPRLEAAKKGKDSVKEGIIFLQGYDIVVHPRCQHTIDELRHYSYRKDPQTDEILPILEDKKNHVIDSLRYAVEKLRAGNEWVTW